MPTIDQEPGRTSYRDLVDGLRERTAHVARGGSPASRARHVARGKLLARDRITALLDPGAPFLEIAPLAAEDMYDGAAPAAGVVAGIGRVQGQAVSYTHLTLPTKRIV